MSADSTPQVAIIDYGMGNLHNVQLACSHVGLTSRITSEPADVLSADGVILPGVGSMPDAMHTLRETGLDRAIYSVIEHGTPFFGICLGMQLLMAEGSEFGSHQGLGIVPGRVERFIGHDSAGRPLRVPHIGWDAVYAAAAAACPWQNTLLAPCDEQALMYFVHSYYVVPEDPTVCVARARYGPVEFCAAIARDRLFACQFHPERSGPQGIAMYRRFADVLQTNAALPSTT